MHRLWNRMSNYMQEWEESFDLPEAPAHPLHHAEPGKSSNHALPALDEFLWQRVQHDYQDSEYGKDDLRSEFNKIISDWLNKGKLVKKDGKISLNK